MVARNRKILVIRSGAIGDFIVTLPVIHLLCERFPSWGLGVVARSRVRPLVEGVVDEFVDVDGPLLVPFFGERINTDSEEYRYLDGCDLVISYLGTTGKVSENLRALRRPRVICANALPPAKYNRHITEFLLEPLAGILSPRGCDQGASGVTGAGGETRRTARTEDVPAPPVPSIRIGEEQARIVEEFLSARGAGLSTPVIAVHPGSGSPRKVSPAASFCQAVNWIQDRLPQAKIMVIQGEADEQDVSAFERCLKTPCLRVKKENLLEVAAILSRASLFIGNDSGIAHLASAVGVSTIVVFRASDPVVWAPRGRDVRVATDESLQGIVQAWGKASLLAR